VTRATTVVTRFAPAPTGYLHLGHVVNAIYVWGLARAAGSGRVLIRIEDHDRQRSRAEFAAAILDDLEWLGLLGVAERSGVVRQHERGELYAEALAGLRRQNLVYACRCSRADIGADDRAAFAREIRYPGTCSGLKLPERPGVGLRVRLAPSIERFEDRRHGPQEQRPFEQCGDLLARDREGNWTYQFASVVDDWLQGVNLVVRGDDLLSSTGRQIQLARLLGREEPPSFFHHPLVMKAPGRKLSKSDGDTGIRELRARGWCAADVLGRAAWLGGLLDAPRPVGASDLAALVPA
jgi:glutamyl-tRNA synthetase/glutamyl-Q tRNA(Asp) synthetase